MHIITGMLIARLLQKRGAKSLVPLLKSGPVRTAHMLPGRVRFVVPTLVGEAQRCESLRDKLASLPGIDSVQTNSITGSVVIRYCEREVQAELLYAAIVRLLGLDAELEKPPVPVVVRELQSMLDSLNRVVHDRTGGLLDFTSALLILLAGLGAKKLFTEGSQAMPGGFTLVWWGLHQLLGGGSGGGEE
jgi:hypothetical protein